MELMLVSNSRGGFSFPGAVALRRRGGTRKSARASAQNRFPISGSRLPSVTGKRDMGSRTEVKQGVHLRRQTQDVTNTGSSHQQSYRFRQGAR